VFTPLKYYYVNIVEHKAANFGEYPWWYYFSLFMLSAVPPVSILLLLLFFIGIRKKPLHLFSLVSITFLIGHFLISHKELRFLFPVEFAFIFLSCIGIDTLLKKYPVQPIYKWSFGICVAINLLLLTFRMFAPAQELVKYYQYIYNYTKKENLTLISFTRSPYNADGLEENFYKPEHLDLRIMDTSQLSAFLTASGKPVLFLSPTITPGPELTGYKTERIYSLFPEWMLQYNFNHWQDRSRIWVIYKVYPK
jgi:phosphatidylinositol glycan class B